MNVKVKDKRDIYIMNPDGTGRIKLSRHNSKDSEPTWSPSGRHILFTSDRDGDYDLYLMTADGRGVKRIFKKFANRLNPAWSPDGQQIAYYRGDEHAIYIADIGGKNEERLVEGWDPTWSPDGSEIAFMSLEGSLDIRAINLKTRSERVVVPREKSILHSPVWSPDGTKIAFSRFHFLRFILKGLLGAKDNASIHTIDIINSDGTEMETVVADEAQVSDPACANSDFYSQLDGKERHKIFLGSLVSEQLTHVGNNYSSEFDPAILSRKVA